VTSENDTSRRTKPSFALYINSVTYTELEVVLHGNSSS